jgi:hypothetical protein
LNKTSIIGYHGCDRELGEQLVSGNVDFDPGSEQYHWLGAGVYFWEEDRLRALEWAEKKKARGACENPFVVGAEIDLGFCLDFHNRENLLLLRDAYPEFVKERTELGLPIPKNKKAKHDRSETKVLRYLDHAVIETLHKASAQKGIVFDTIRGTFSEGDPIYPGSGILDLMHSQIAVRNLACIVNVFSA